MRKMILAVTSEQKKAALDLLLPFQRSDFEGIFCAMDGTVLFYQLKLSIWICRENNSQVIPK